LPELTAHDLTDLGVSVVGHRRKLLGAFVALRSGVGLVSGSPIAASTVERRQLTVMFCDLVGATELPRSWIRRTCARSSMRIIAPWPICCSPARRPHGDDDRPGRSKGLAGLPPFLNLTDLQDAVLQGGGRRRASRAGGNAPMPRLVPSSNRSPYLNPCAAWLHRGRELAMIRSRRTRTPTIVMLAWGRGGSGSVRPHTTCRTCTYGERRRE
jgi:hypothetical protein